ncbi:hypothetical protein [Acinetobacter dispersus]|uniref:hypothetical protein n=1 Tax=Acinetobacter dispersus TaxID=70348 RepID=UPI00039CEDD1
MAGPLSSFITQFREVLANNPEQEQSTALIAAQGEAQGQGYFLPLLRYVSLT